MTRGEVYLKKERWSLQGLRSKMHVTGSAKQGGEREGVGMLRGWCSGWSDRQWMRWDLDDREQDCESDEIERKRHWVREGIWVPSRERICVIDTEGEGGISCGFHFLTFGVIIYLGLTYLLYFFFLFFNYFISLSLICILYDYTFKKLLVLF
jgi:hypothetical protein